mmetsp:Transcript_23134/g.33149  ORF Transcript_23134/g.33149 Transcript_23134/m.33149 type:complete len:160 (+) Transcript_23134:116-595(+)|eukprot:CAMPEP_0202443404 /NCGR_PEP_ID=MMETSP1360-20130828/2682_1 /ASSEMBLY_ACC=CAM_ASM_000848 /TAXON_ID=515479 /ORGANISM="Licmophora paradoxa, Strain CCMP2313" /LENGTH=159 /DNA_ID=CAMNT_0049059085 /DNA_START=12 /DNA_END=491 /DNA_ORIENTATION=-
MQQDQEGSTLHLHKRDKRTVVFSDVHIRDYSITLGNNPSVSIGAPISLSWEYDVRDPITVQEYERSKRGRKRLVRHHKPQPPIMSYYKRHEILHEMGFDDKAIRKAEQQAKYDKLRRSLSKQVCFPQRLNDSIKAEVGRIKNLLYLNTYNRKWSETISQ